MFWEVLCLSILYRGKSEDKQVNISLNLDFCNMFDKYILFLCIIVLLKYFSNAVSTLNQTLLPTYATYQSYITYVFVNL